jgi:hypothetical protein
MKEMQKEREKDRIVMQDEREKKMKEMQQRGSKR